VKLRGGFVRIDFEFEIIERVGSLAEQHRRTSQYHPGGTPTKKLRLTEFHGGGFPLKSNENYLHLESDKWPRNEAFSPGG
jgi:hypothetical protein